MENDRFEAFSLELVGCLETRVRQYTETRQTESKAYVGKVETLMVVLEVPDLRG